MRNSGDIMYKTSHDLRFVKNRTALRRAYIDLVQEKGSSSVTVKELAQRANVNRMTFYAHYDTVDDILCEYVDEMTSAILENSSKSGETDVAGLFEAATEQMRQEIGFFRHVAKEDGFELFRGRFRNAFRHIFKEELMRVPGLCGTRLELTADMIASGVTYAYLGWLAGEYGDLPLDELVSHFEGMYGGLLGVYPDGQRGSGR